MAKWFGLIGFSESKETATDVWEEVITTREYYGDIVKSNYRIQTTDQVIDNFNVSNNISVIADTFATENFQHMKYIEYMGAKWKIVSAEVQYPRIIISMGGVYNDDEQRAIK